MLPIISRRPKAKWFRVTGRMRSQPLPEQILRASGPQAAKREAAAHMKRAHGKHAVPVAVHQLGTCSECGDPCREEATLCAPCGHKRTSRGGV
jgi:hypothetical protein